VSIYVVPRLRPDIKSDFRKMSKGWSYFALAATISYVANFFSYYSVSLTKTSYVVLVGQTQPFFVLLVMAIIGRFGFLKTKESFDRSAVMQKLAGFVIMLTGMAVSLLIKP
jgi:drug/metabolite transporter (DMT)-like permease